MFLDFSFVLSHEIISSFIVALFALIIYIISLLVIRQIFVSSSKKIGRIVTRITGGIILFISVIIILKIWSIDLTYFLACGMIILLILGLSVIDLFKDLVNGIKISISKSYSEGDIIEVNGYKGTVTKIDLLNTIITGINGEVKIISDEPDIYRVWIRAFSVYDV